MFLNQLERRMEIVHGAASKALREKYAQSKAAIEVNRETMDKLQRWLHNNNSYYLTYKALAQINPEEIADKVLIILKDEKPKCSGKPKKGEPKMMPLSLRASIPTESFLSLLIWLNKYLLLLSNFGSRKSV